MELNEVLEFIKQNKGLKSMELQQGDFSIKLEWNADCAPTAAPSALPVQMDTADGSETTVIPGGHDNARDVVSPLVGTYHELEGARKVEIGSKLRKGELLCHVEAMKLMNEIVMPEDGEIVWKACAEGDTVEYEQLLFRYE